MIHEESKYFAVDSEILAATEFKTIYPENAEPVYEVIRIIRNKAVFLSEHLQRLRQSAKILGFNIPDEREIKSSIAKNGLANSIHNGNIRIDVFKQSGNTRILIYFIPHRYPTDEEYNCGVWIETLKASRKRPSVKQFNSDLRVKTDEILRKPEIYEVALVKDGSITEGSRSNIFFIKDNQLLTAPKNFVLEGITRMKTLELANKNGIATEERLIPLNSSSSFQACFITGTSPKILPVYRIDNFNFNPQNPILRKLMRLYDQAVERELMR